MTGWEMGQKFHGGHAEYAAVKARKGFEIGRCSVDVRVYEAILGLQKHLSSHAVGVGIAASGKRPVPIQRHSTS